MALTITSWVIICAVSYGICSIIVWHLRRRHLYELASKFEGPPALPIIGNTHMFLGNTENVMKQLNKMAAEYSSPVRQWFGPLLIFLITDPEQIQAICQSPKTLAKGPFVESFGASLLGNGLITAPVSIWKTNRKIILPTFHAKIVESFGKIFTTQSKIMAEQWKRHVDGPQFEIFRSVSYCTLDMICETAIDVKVEAQVNEHSDYVEALDEIFNGLIKRFCHIWLWPEFIFQRSKLGKNQKKYLKYIHDFTKNVMQLRKNKIVESGVRPDADQNESDAHSDPKLRREAFLDHLMKLTGDNGKLSDQQLCDEVITMIVTGNDTSAHTISMVMLMLASHPDVQDKVYQELSEIYGDADIEEFPVTCDDLSRMQYLENVIKETLRLFPTVAYIVREVAADLEIGAHCTLPAGSLVELGIINVHRNEKYWPNPWKFQPDRFLPEEVGKRPAHTFLAFSYGPRNCIGTYFAMMSMKMLLATILRRYVLKKDDIVPNQDIRFKLDVFMKPVDPITLRIERRS